MTGAIILDSEGNQTKGRILFINEKEIELLKKLFNNYEMAFGKRSTKGLKN